MKRNSDQLQDDSSAKSSEAPSRLEISKKISDQCIVLRDPEWKPTEISLSAPEQVPPGMLEVFHTNYTKEELFRADVFSKIVEPSLSGFVSF
jgi:hypothetical protein